MLKRKEKKKTEKTNQTKTKFHQRMETRNRKISFTTGNPMRMSCDGRVHLRLDITQRVL